MIKRSAAVFAALAIVSAAALLAPPSARAQGFTMKKDIVVAAGEVQDNVFTMGGTVLVEGKVLKSVVAIGGTVTIAGEVGDAVVGVGSHVILKSTAVVNGDVAALGGVLDREAGSAVKGDTVYFKASEIGSKIFREDVLRGALSMSLIPFLLVFKLITFFLWLMAALLGALLLPRQIASASESLRGAFWPTFGTGFLAVIAFGGLVLLSAMLSLILIGIPLLIALIFGGALVKAFGRVAIFYFFGESLLRAMGSRKITAVGASLLGLVVVTLLSFVPLLGFIFTFVINILGWGLVIRTKFGTKLPAWAPSGAPAA